MDPNEFEEFDELEDIDPEATEEMLDNELEESSEYYPEEYDQHNYRKRPTYGKEAYEEALDENGKYDKKYHVNRIEEADEKLKNAKEELNNNNLKNDPTFVGPAKPDGTLREKSKAEHKLDKKNVRDAQREKREAERRRLQANIYRLNTIKDKTLHPIDNAKEAAKEKAKDVAKNVGKKAAKATGKLAATGVKALITFVASNPFALGIVAVIAVVILFILLFTNTAGDSTPSGYFDTRCDFNLTAIKCSDDLTMSLEDYTIEKTKDIINQYTLSEEKIKALMIIFRTNALAEGGYDSNGDKILSLDNCGSTYDGIDYGVYNTNNLEQYYDDIDNFLFVSKSYRSEITDLGSVDVLEYNDEIIDKLVNSTKTSYSEILEELYPNSENDDEMITSSNDKPFIFVGDSRTVGMENAVGELNGHTVAKSSMGYDWFVDTAIDSVNLKTRNNSYNIVSWMGVNNLASNGSKWAQTYFDKYKELAQGAWKNHTIYVVKVGPVVDAKTYYVDNDEIDAFNSKIQELINDANINNLKYLDIDYSITSYDTEGLHYGSKDYSNIYKNIKSKISNSKTISKNKELYNMSDYCSYFRYYSDCEIGWWWPIGEAGNFNKGDILRGDPQLASIGSGEDYGWRVHPTKGVLKWHSGEDLAASHGMNVIASRSGTVITAVDGVPDNSGSGCGNYIDIDHGDGYYSKYCHLKNGSVKKYVTVNMKVVQGQIIGQADNTGTSTGDHLHFEIRYGSLYGGHDSTRNPLDYISVDDPRPVGNCNTGNYSNDKEGVCRALKNNSLSDNAVAGIMANLQNESGYDATLKVVDSNGLYSYGLMMWNGNNGTKLLNYCSENWQDVKCQTDFIIKYIEDSSQYGSVFNAKPYVYGSYDANTIGQQFCLKLERCSKCIAYSEGKEVPGSECIRRGNIADNLLNYVKNGCRD